MPHILMQTTEEFDTILKNNAKIVSINNNSYMFLPFWFKKHFEFVEHDNGGFNHRYVWELFSLNDELPEDLKDEILKTRK